LIEYFPRFYRKIKSTLQRIYYSNLQGVGSNVFFGRDIRIEHPEYVSLGDNVYLNDFCWISIVKHKSENNTPKILKNPSLIIGDRTYIGRFATIACVNKIKIGEDVLISDRVFIGDVSHGYERNDLPIKDQDLMDSGPVEIGSGSWIGIGVSILPNIKIGKNCVIGAGAVVTRDIPDYSTAAGVPAKIIKINRKI